MKKLLHSSLLLLCGILVSCGASDGQIEHLLDVQEVILYRVLLLIFYLILLALVTL